MNTTIKHRTLTRAGHVWSIEVQEIKGHGKYDRVAVLRRNGDEWATATKTHGGKLTILYTKVGTIPLPETIIAEIRKDLGLQN